MVLWCQFLSRPLLTPARPLLQIHLRAILKRMQSCGIDTRSHNYANHKIIDQKESVKISKQISEPSAARSRRASVAMLSSALPLSLSSLDRNPGSALLPAFPDAILTDTDNKVTKEGGHLSALPNEGHVPKDVVDQSPTPGTTVPNPLRSRRQLLNRASRSGTRLRVVDHEPGVSSTRTNFESTMRSDYTLHDTDRHSDTLPSSDQRSVFLSDISNAIERMILWSHPT